MVQELLEPCDVGRLLGVGPQRVTQLAQAGRIRVFGRTPRGVRLFRASDVTRMLRARAQSRAISASGRRRLGGGDSQHAAAFK
jgi:hypothetical protein